jgi:hypothetical protein
MNQIMLVDDKIIGFLTYDLAYLRCPNWSVRLLEFHGSFSCVGFSTLQSLAILQIAACCSTELFFQGFGNC